MPPARSASRAAPRRPARRSTSRTSTAARAGVGIRWDRLGRIALLLVLAVILLTYVGPLRSYWTTWHEAGKRRAEVTRFEAEHKRLLARRAQLSSPATLEREARRLGMVRPGERAYATVSPSD